MKLCRIIKSDFDPQMTVFSFDSVLFLFLSLLQHACFSSSFLTFHWLTFYHTTPFRIKPSLVAIHISEHVFFSDERLLLEMLEFFEISRGSYQPLNFLP